MITSVFRYFKITVLITLLVSSIYLYLNNKKIKEDLLITKSNEKAYIQENSELKNTNNVFQFNINQLNYFNDSLLVKLNDTRKELDIKDKNLRQLQYLLTTANKVDTVIIKDTLFRDITLDIDTIIGDKWYNTELKLKYPNIIVINSTFNSELSLITHVEKEYINPPKKYWISRIFQRRHDVLKVEIIEENPYSKVKKTKFIEILK